MSEVAAVGPLLLVNGPALPSEPDQYENFLTNSQLLLAVSNSEGVGRANRNARFRMGGFGFIGV